MMYAVLSNAAHPEYGAVTIPFPIPGEDFDHCMELVEALEIGKVSARDCRVDEISSGWPILGRRAQTSIWMSWIIWPNAWTALTMARLPSFRP